MIKIKLEKTKKNNLVFKLGGKESDIGNIRLLKRALMESKKISGRYSYEVPLRYLIPILNNIPKNQIKLDPYSQLYFLEFWDEYEERYYSIIEASPQFMKYWRYEGCPNIFKVMINKDTLEVKKEVAFKKIQLHLG